MNVWLSRFLYAPHNLPELIGAAFGWMLLATVPAIIIAYLEWRFTPEDVREDKDHRYSRVFLACLLYAIFFFAVVFPLYCVVPMYVPALHQFLELKNYQ